ncbi:coiled-coil domain-containing protein 34 [Anableps anableps]
MPKFSPSVSEGFSSTPVKASLDNSVYTVKGLDNGVVSDDEDTFSLLSPIYHDSYDSDEEELKYVPVHQTLPSHRKVSRLCASPARSELPKTPLKQRLSEPVQIAGSPPLSAWEMWLLSKATEDRLRLEKKSEEERLLKEKQEQQERKQEHKKLVKEMKIHEWLKVKKEQEKQEQLVKQRKEEEMQRQQEKQREIKQKSQQKYRDWLEKKNQEKLEKEKKEKMKAALKEEQDRERRRKAEEKFKEWLTKANEKTRASPKTHSHATSPYDKWYPAPSFYNPIPWKPIHVPPPETSPNKTSGRKPQKQKKTQQSPCTAFRQRNTGSAAHFLYRR